MKYFIFHYISSPNREAVNFLNAICKQKIRSVRRSRIRRKLYNVNTNRTALTRKYLCLRRTKINIGKIFTYSFFHWTSSSLCHLEYDLWSIINKYILCERSRHNKFPHMVSLRLYNTHDCEQVIWNNIRLWIYCAHKFLETVFCSLTAFDRGNLWCKHIYLQTQSWA